MRFGVAVVASWLLACEMAVQGTSEATTGPVGDEGVTTGDPFACDPWLQDCPSGQKCAAWDDRGGAHWNATKCVEVAPGAKAAGQPCSVQGSVASGLDDCDAGSFCWYVEQATLQGVCAPRCTGSAEAWDCPDTRHCDIGNGGALLLCLQTCDPLVPSCPSGQICFGSVDDSQFVCDAGNVGTPGDYGEPCEYINSCAYGLFCAFPRQVPGCEGEGCCSEYCDLGQPNSCAGAGGGQECVAWFADGEAPPGLEDVGYCTIPS